MKRSLLLLFLIIIAVKLFSQQSSMIIPGYSGPDVNGLSSFTTNGSFSTTAYGFDQTTYPNFKHTCQNAWFENGKLLFYVISGVDQSTGNHTLVYNANGKIVADVNDIIPGELAVNEIGLFKVSCSFFNIIINRSIYGLILEPYNTNSLGGMVKMGELPDAFHSNVNGAATNCNGIIRGGTSFAVSQPIIFNFDKKDINNYYTVYYIANKSKTPTLNYCNVFYNNNTYSGSGSNKTIQVSISSTTILKNLIAPFAYSNITELELSPDQKKVAYTDLDEVSVYDLTTNTTYTYDAANNFPNFGLWTDCTSYFRGQACGIEFSPNSNDLVISFFDVFLNNGWPIGADAIGSWNYATNTYTPVIGTDKYANSFIEMGLDNYYYALGKNLTTNQSYILKIDPITLGIVETLFTNFNLNFRSFSCTIGSCQIVQGNLGLESQFYTLQDQIDGMDYTFFNTDNCCSLPSGLLTQLDDLYRVSSTEIWENDDIMYRDVHVLSGATLTIKNCTINFKENAKIIVEAGGKLYVDNAKLTNECNALWPGIEIEGSAGNHDINKQGFVWLKNNSIVEHAVQAVLVNPRAILYATSGSKILNCVYGIAFLSCPSIADNLSFLQDVTFECSTLIPTQTLGTIKFLEFTGINWAGVYGCTFKNTLPYSTLGADNRGTGVEIHNSNITFHKTHNVYDAGTKCFIQFGLYNNFSKLTYGILAVESEHIVVNYANFYDCQSSIEITSSGESHITNSIFTLDQNYVYRLRSFQDFIFLFSVNGYHISENTFDWHEPLSVFNGINGVRIEGTSSQLPTTGGQLRNNIFTYDNFFNPTIIPDVTGIYMSTALTDIKVEWNIFNALMVDWLLTNTCNVQDQTPGAECRDPYNRWSQAPYTYKHILNNGSTFSYCSNTANTITSLNPQFPSSAFCTNVVFATTADDVLRNLIICPYPTFDAGWGVNSVVRVPKKDIYVTIQPNPISLNKQNLDYRIKNTEIVNKLTIFDNNGREVYQKLNQPTSGSINIGECNVSQGIYYLQAVTVDGIVGQRFIVR